MFAFLRLFKAVPPSTLPRHDRDEAYLAEATDLYDLERRMREIDRRNRSAPQDQMLGVW